jgi:hypothetical protein
MAELMIKVRNARSVTSNLFTIKGFDANFGALFRIASEVDSILKDFDDYYREAYKGEIRAYIAANMSGDITFDIIKANFPTAFQGQPFHAELVEELITEDYSSDAQAARQKALKKLALEDDESETEKAAQAGRLLLIDGLHTLGSIGDILQKIIEKIEHNHEIYRNRKKTFAEMIMEFIALMFSKKRMADFYECEMPDANDSKTEIIDYHLFVEELNNKVKILLLFIVGGTANIKLENISDSEILEHINQNIYDIQRYSRLLTALDEFFKTKTDKHNKIYIKGIKPEISTIKIALSKVIQKKEYYLAGEKFLEQLPI